MSEKNAKTIAARKQFPFMQLRNIGYVLSVLMMIASVVLVQQRGLNFGIDFTGGVLMELRSSEDTSLADFRASLPEAEFGSASWQLSGEQDVLLRLPNPKTGKPAELVEAAKAQLLTTFGEVITFRKVDFVGPQVGDELMRSGAMAIGFSFLAIMLYVWFRFEWQFGLGAIIALLHDVVLTLGFMALLQLEFNLSSVAAVLTIIGYSINDSVVIYDRIRENMRRYKKMALDSLINASLNETLSRTLLTAGTTMVALLALILFGGRIVADFSLAILFGVVVGTYSSLFVAAPVLMWIKPRAEDMDADTTSM